ESDHFSSIQELNGQRIRSVSSIVEDSYGNVWFSSNEAGLFCHKTEGTIAINKKDLPFEAAITGLAILSDSLLAITYTNGLCIYNILQNQFYNYSELFDLPNFETSTNALFAINNTLWVGAKNEIYSFAINNTTALGKPKLRIH